MAKKIIIILLLILFIGAGLILFLLNYEDKRSEENFSALQDIASNFQSPPQSSTDTSPENINPTQQNTTQTSGSNSNSWQELPSSYNQLYDLNNDFMGWLSIPNTNVNYPVVQSVDDPNFYLNHDFYKKYSSYGVPYIDERYNIDTSQNALIYGHSMTNTTMFADLLKYNTFDYYSKNKIIEYTDKYGYSEYEIFSIFAIDINDPFDYNNYINMDENRFNNFIENAINYSIHPTDITPKYTDKLITLSTCENTSDDMRFVVIGVKIY